MSRTVKGGKGPGWERWGNYLERQEEAAKSRLKEYLHPMTRKIITNYAVEHLSHVEQLKALADDLLKHMRNNITEPREFKTYAESFAIVSKLLDSGELSTDIKSKDTSNVDTSEFE